MRATVPTAGSLSSGFQGGSCGSRCGQPSETQERKRDASFHQGLGMNPAPLFSTRHLLPKLRTRPDSTSLIFSQDSELEFILNPRMCELGY